MLSDIFFQKNMLNIRYNMVLRQLLSIVIIEQTLVELYQFEYIILIWKD